MNHLAIKSGFCSCGIKVAAAIRVCPELPTPGFVECPGCSCMQTKFSFALAANVQRDGLRAIIRNCEQSSESTRYRCDGETGQKEFLHGVRLNRQARGWSMDVAVVSCRSYLHAQKSRFTLQRPQTPVEVHRLP
jgi:hypothetical protein